MSKCKFHEIIIEIFNQICSESYTARKFMKIYISAQCSCPILQLVLHLNCAKLTYSVNYLVLRSTTRTNQ